MTISLAASTLELKTNPRNLCSSPSVQNEMEISLETLALEMADRLGVHYAAASFIPGSSKFVDGVFVGDVAYVPYGSALCASVLNQDDVLQLQELDKNSQYSKNPFVCGSPYIRSFIGIAIRGRKNEVVGAMCGFSSFNFCFSEESANIVRSYARRAAAVLEIMNTSETLNAMKMMKDLARGADYLAFLGYEEAAKYVVSLLYNNASKEDKRSEN